MEHAVIYTSGAQGHAGVMITSDCYTRIMTEEEAKKWVKDKVNQRKVLEQFFNKYTPIKAKVAWQLTQARELVKKRAIEKSGFIDTCNKIIKNLNMIFSIYKNHKPFNFWILYKRGAPGMENATAIIHGSGMDKQSEIEKELDKTYNVGEIG